MTATTAASFPPEWDLPDVSAVCTDLSCLPVPLTEEQSADLRRLAEWHREEGLPKAADIDLVKFLHSCEYDLQKAKKCAKDFYAGRLSSPEIFSDWDVDSPKQKAIHEVVSMAVLPRKTPENYRIVVCSLYTSDASGYDVLETLRGLLMLMETILLTEPTINGVVIVQDIKNITFTHFFKAAWGMPRKLKPYMEDGLPIIRRSSYLMNSPSLVERGLRIIRHIGSQKDWDLLQVYGEDFSGLHKQVPVDCLPSDLGGTLPSMRELHAMNIQRLRTFKTAFERSLSVLYDDQ